MAGSPTGGTTINVQETLLITRLPTGGGNSQTVATPVIQTTAVQLGQQSVGTNPSQEESYEVHIPTTAGTLVPALLGQADASGSFMFISASKLVILAFKQGPGSLNTLAIVGQYQIMTTGGSYPINSVVITTTIPDTDVQFYGLQP